MDRFSTYLDFDLINGTKDLDIKTIDNILSKNLKIEDSRKKRYTLFWLGSYIKGLRKVKVEVNLINCPNEYEVKKFRGYSMLVMKPEYMFAHKLCAVLDRKNLQNRDLYDVWFMFKQNFSISEKIVELRVGKGIKEYLRDLLKLVDDLPKDYDVLSGLGEVLTRGKKNWVKSKLLGELRAELASRI